MDFPGGSVVKNPPAVQELHGTWIWSLDREDPLEEVMAAHSSILLREIPWTEESGRFIGSQGCKRGHDWRTEHRVYTLKNCDFYIFVLGITSKYILFI